MGRRRSGSGLVFILVVTCEPKFIQQNQNLFKPKLVFALSVRQVKAQKFHLVRPGWRVAPREAPSLVRAIRTQFLKLCSLLESTNLYNIESSIKLKQELTQKVYWTGSYQLKKSCEPLKLALLNIHGRAGPGRSPWVTFLSLTRP